MGKWMLVGMLLFGFNLHAAEDLNDVGTDVEEMSADSEAAQNAAADLKARLKREHRENELKLREAEKQRVVAAKKTAEATDQLNRDTHELDRVLAARRKTQGEIDVLNKQIATAEARMHDSQLKTEGAHRELASIQEAKIARQKKLADARHQAEQAKLAQAQAQKQLDASKQN